MLHHHLQGGKSRFIFFTSFHSSRFLWSSDHLSTFSASFSSASVVFCREGPIGSTCSFFPTLTSVCPFILTLAFTRFHVLNVRRVLCMFFISLFFSPTSLRLSLDEQMWGPRSLKGVEWKTEFVHSKCKEERKWERGMDERMDGGMEGGVWGCIWCEALQRRVRESKPTTTWCHVPLSTSRHPSVSLFLKDSFILLFYFPPRFFSFSQFFSFFIVACTAQETLSCEQYPLQKLSLVMFFYFSPMSTSVY